MADFKTVQKSFCSLTVLLHEGIQIPDREPTQRMRWARKQCHQMHQLPSITRYIDLVLRIHSVRFLINHVLRKQWVDEEVREHLQSLLEKRILYLKVIVSHLALSIGVRIPTTSGNQSIEMASLWEGVATLEKHVFKEMSQSWVLLWFAPRSGMDT